MTYQRILAAAAFAVVTTVSTHASAVVVSDGTYSAGVGDSGQLYDGSVGLARGGFDVIAQGFNFRDSWGLNGYAIDPDFFGVEDGSTLVTGGGASATAVTTFAGDFSVEQTYSFVDGILTIDTAVTNIGTVASGLFFQRNVDWDLDPSFDGEEVYEYGGSNRVVGTTHYGFDDPTGFGPYYAGCPSSCGTPGDLGAGIRLKLGTLNAGATRTFTFYYGLNAAGEGADSLTVRTMGAGAQLVLTGNSQSGDNAATLGVSVGAVPEPATWAMMLLGFFGLGSMIRRRRAALA